MINYKEQKNTRTKKTPKSNLAPFQFTLANMSLKNITLKHVITAICLLLILFLLVIFFYDILEFIFTCQIELSNYILWTVRGIFISTIIPIIFQKKNSKKIQGLSVTFYMISIILLFLFTSEDDVIDSNTRKGFIAAGILNETKDKIQKKYLLNENDSLNFTDLQPDNILKVKEVRSIYKDKWLIKPSGRDTKEGLEVLIQKPYWINKRRNCIVVEIQYKIKQP